MILPSRLRAGCGSLSSSKSGAAVTQEQRLDAVSLHAPRPRTSSRTPARTRSSNSNRLRPVNRTTSASGKGVCLSSLFDESPHLHRCSGDDCCVAAVRFGIHFEVSMLDHPANRGHRPIENSAATASLSETLAVHGRRHARHVSVLRHQVRLGTVGSSDASRTRGQRRDSRLLLVAVALNCAHGPASLVVVGPRRSRFRCQRAVISRLPAGARSTRSSASRSSVGSGTLSGMPGEQLAAEGEYPVHLCCGECHGPIISASPERATGADAAPKPFLDPRVSVP